MTGLGRASSDPRRVAQRRRITPLQLEARRLLREVRRSVVGPLPDPALPSARGIEAFLRALGYRGTRSRVVFEWDEMEGLLLDDGVECWPAAADLARAYLADPVVEGWLDRHGVHLHEGCESPTHVLVADRAHGRLFAFTPVAAQETLLVQALDARRVA